MLIVFDGFKGQQRSGRTKYINLVTRCGIILCLKKVNIVTSVILGMRPAQDEGKVPIALDGVKMSAEVKV